MAQFRFHRGGLAESMATVRPVADLATLSHMLSEEGWAGDVKIAHYAFDARIGWDTHIVTVDGITAGFTDGPLD